MKIKYDCTKFYLDKDKDICIKIDIDKGKNWYFYLDKL